MNSLEFKISVDLNDHVKMSKVINFLNDLNGGEPIIIGKQESPEPPKEKVTPPTEPPKEKVIPPTEQPEEKRVLVENPLSLEQVRQVLGPKVRNPANRPAIKQWLVDKEASKAGNLAEQHYADFVNYLGTLPDLEA